MPVRKTSAFMAVRFAGNAGASRQTTLNASGTTGGYLACGGASGRLGLRYPNPMASAFAVAT